MSIKITAKAEKEIHRIVEEQKTQDPTETNFYVRVKVIGGGCSGFQTKLTIENEINEKLDESYDINSIKVIVDKRSAMYVGDATIDFLDDMNSHGFKIDNPSAKSTCGCGSSFSM